MSVITTNVEDEFYYRSIYSQTLKRIPDRAFIVIVDECLQNVIGCCNDEYSSYYEKNTLDILTRWVNQTLCLKKGDILKFPCCMNMEGTFFWSGTNVLHRCIKNHLPSYWSVPEFSPLYFSEGLIFTEFCWVDHDIRKDIEINMEYGFPPIEEYNDGETIYSWFNQPIEISKLYRDSLIIYTTLPDTLTDLIIQFAGKTCWIICPLYTEEKIQAKLLQKYFMEYLDFRMNNGTLYACECPCCKSCRELFGLKKTIAFKIDSYHKNIKLYDILYMQDFLDEDYIVYGRN